MSQDKPKMPASIPPFVDEVRFAIVKAGFNGALVEALYQQVLATLTEYKVNPESIKTWDVPGSGEIPYLANLVARQNFDCVIALGVVIAGDTPHHEIIAHSTAQALQEVGLKTQVPVINGIIVTNNREQAEVRCLGPQARGKEFAQAALVMAQHKINLSDSWEAWAEETDDCENN